MYKMVWNMLAYSIPAPAGKGCSQQVPESSANKKITVKKNECISVWSFMGKMQPQLSMTHQYNSLQQDIIVVIYYFYSVSTGAPVKGQDPIMLVAVQTHNKKMALEAHSLVRFKSVDK